MILSADPSVVRKAAAFVEAIERVESDFGIDLVADAPIRFAEKEWPASFGLVRVPGEERRLAIVFPEAAPPRFPIHGRD